MLKKNIDERIKRDWGLLLMRGLFERFGYGKGSFYWLFEVLLIFDKILLNLG